MKLGIDNLRIIQGVFDTLVEELKQRDEIIDGLRSMTGESNFREMLRMVKQDYDKNPIQNMDIAKAMLDEGLNKKKR